MKPTSSTTSTNTSGPNNQPAGKPGPSVLKSRSKGWVWPVVIVGLVLLAAAGMVGVAYASQANTIVKNVRAGSSELGGLDSLAALNELEQRWNRFSQQAFVFVYKDERVTIPVGGSSASAEEVILDLATFEIQGTVDQAFDYGHTGPRWKQAWERLLGWLGRDQAVGRFNFSRQSLRDVLKQEFGQHDQPAVNAGLTLEADGTFSVKPSQPGQVIDYDQAVASARARLIELSLNPITVETKIVQPEIPTSASLDALAVQAKTLVARAPISMTLEEPRWEISAERLGELLGFVSTAKGPRIGFDLAKTTEFLESLRAEIDIQPRDAKFKVVGGRVEEFQTSVVGRTLNTAATVAALDQAVFERSEKTVAVVVEEVTPLTDTVTTNDLGIKELVAEGVTNFRGSPPNRVYNLSLGADRLHGLLIKPGETFSLVDALGKIDQAHGWKPELVIKGTRITPEYGGGLCQVATTLFRAALNTGLPIVERTNHSLRISYYEPPIGLDATIYEPRPDLKFRNDYTTALLLQTRVEGTQMIFSFYGTKDGRTVDIPEPKVFNRVPIPPTSKVEVDDLPPGVEECQAPGHAGADAIATYTVTRLDGTTVTQVFKSHYRALPVICRVGKKTS